MRRAGLAALGDRPVLVAGEHVRAVHVGGRKLRFHGSMGVLRVRRMIAGEGDPLVDALEVEPGETIVDATAGLAADALVIAHAVGSRGRVIAIEASPLLLALLQFGVARPTGEGAIDAALARIEPVLADHRPWLAAAPPASAGAVYLDPMFRTATAAPPGFEVLRALADPRPLEPDVVEGAARVARRRVVVQDARRGRELERLGLTILPSSRHASTRFGFRAAG